MSTDDAEISAAGALAMLQGLALRADQGPGNAYLVLYATAHPAAGTAHTDPAQATIVLTDPCGTMLAGVLVLHPLEPAGAMVALAGMPRWAEWFAADGVWLARLRVTDALGDGHLQVIGGHTPEGETSPMLYPGGLVQLGGLSLS